MSEAECVKSQRSSRKGRDVFKLLEQNMPIGKRRHWFHRTFVGGYTLALAGWLQACREAVRPALTGEELPRLRRPRIGAHGLSYHAYEDNPATITLNLRRRQPVSSFVLVGVGGLVASFAAPLGATGNIFSARGPVLQYFPYPGYGNALYVCPNYQAGARLAISSTKQTDPGGEFTLSAVEILDANKLQALSINYPKADQPQRSDAVTTTGPALLLAWWWGDADGKRAHTARPGPGFVVLESILLRGGLVQCCLAYRLVEEAGSYDITWQSSPKQGAILWLAALQ